MSIHRTSRPSSWRRPLVAVALVAASTAIGAGTLVAGSSEPPVDEGSAGAAVGATITVTGHGTVTAEPDIATVSLGVQASAPSVAGALEPVQTGSDQLVEFLTSEGIDPADIQTNSIDVYTYRNERENLVTEASVNVTVTIRDLDAVGALIDGAANAVGNGFTIHGLSFGIDDPSTMLPEARAEAVADARAKAEQYAAAAGVELGDIVSMTDGSVAAPPVPLVREVADAAGSTESMAVEPGTLDVSAQVTIVFELA